MTSTFLAALALTVLALAAVVWSGVAGRRPLHYGAIVAMFAVLAWAIREAETMGRALVFDGAADHVKTVHMAAVVGVFLLVPLLVVSGVRLAKGEDPGRRRLHGQLAKVFVVLVVLTCALGAAMTMLARPDDGEPAADALGQSSERPTQSTSPSKPSPR